MKLKRLWCALIVLALLTAGSLFNEKKYQDLSTELDTTLRDAVTAVRRGNIKQGERGMRAFQDKVDGYLPFLNMTTSHHEVDELLVALARGITCLEQQRLEDFYVEAAELLQKIEHIYDSECIKWDNIL